MPFEGSVLTRIFHANLLRKPGKPMTAALDSGVSLGSMYAYSPALKSSSALPHQASLLPRHDQSEILGLTRMFHADLLRKPGKPMTAALDSGLSLDSMYAYSPALKSSSALPHQASLLPRHDQSEISGLSSSKFIITITNHH